GECEIKESRDNQSECGCVGPDRRAASSLDCYQRRGSGSILSSCKGDSSTACWAARTIREHRRSYTSWKSCENTERNRRSCTRCQGRGGSLNTTSSTICNRQGRWGCCETEIERCSTHLQGESSGLSDSRRTTSG